MKRSDITALFPDATKEQIDALLNINGADIEAAKSPLADLQAQLDAATTRANDLELRPTTEEIAAVRSELDALKAANAAREMREAVAKETGVPARLLVGDDEEACKTQAANILEFAKPGQYPAVRDGGEVTPPSTHQTTAQQFADWFNNAI